MPAPRATELVNPPPRIPGSGRWPADVIEVRARDTVVTSPDGVPFRGMFCTWVYDDTVVQVRGFRIYLRPKDTAQWWLAGQTDNVREFELFDPRFESSQDWQLAVVAVGLFCCTWRPPDFATTGVAEFRMLEREECPPPPGGLRLTRVQDRMLLEWDPPATPGVPTYEVRLGSERVDLNAVLARTTSTQISLHDVPPVDHVAGAPSLAIQVGVLKPNGRLGAVGRLTSVAVPWSEAGNVQASVVGSASSWTGGSSAELSANASNFLELTDQADTSGVFTGTVVDVGALLEYSILPVLLARRTNLVLTPFTTPFAPLSLEGCRRSPFGRAEEAYPREGIDRFEGWTPNTMPETPNGSGGAPFSFASLRPEHEAIHTPVESRWSPNSEAMKSYTPAEGFQSTAGTGAVLEMRFSDDNATWSAWEVARPTTQTTRYIGWRVTVSQPFPAYKVEVEDVFIVALAEPATSGDQSVSILKDNEGDTAPDVVRFTVQAPTTGRRLVTVAVADASYADPTASAGLAVAAGSGSFIGSGNPGASMQVETDASGEVQVDVTETGAKTRYFRASIEGHPVVELEATWT